MTQHDERKLPTWARALLETERVNASLSWPTVLEPQPIAVYDANGMVISGHRLNSSTAWCFYSDDRAERVDFDATGLISRGVGFATRPWGKYYLTKRDALAALWWEKARQYAGRLHVIKERFSDAG